ncbi:MAG: PilN domain-containing protein [Alistipes sp.]|nr:PilN domain-containing protein [Alistipes sp.]
MKWEKEIPVIAVFCGHGIISKSRETLPQKVLESISGHGEEFIWSEKEGIITLMWREQASVAMDQLNDPALSCVSVTVSAASDDEAVLKAALSRIPDLIRIRRILKADRTGSILSTILYNRIKLPFLALVLCLLVGNYFIGEKARADYASSTAEVQALRKAAGAAGETDRQRKAMLDGYIQKIPHGFSWICDRIAIVLPKSMTLTSLKVQPALKKPENGKPLQLDERRVEISGEATNTEDINLFISALSRLEFARAVKMVALHQNRNSGELEFRLQLDL